MTLEAPDPAWRGNHATIDALNVRLETLRRFHRRSGSFGLEVLQRSDVHGRRVLEIGAGTGVHAATFFRREEAVPASWVLLDRSEAMVREARTALASTATVRYLVADAERLPIARSARFNLVVAMHVLPFVAAPRPLLREIARRLVPGGRLLVTTSDDDMQELRQPVREVLRARGLPWRHVGPGYAAARAQRDLSAVFERVATYGQDGRLEFSCTEWPRRYVLSMGWFEGMPQDVLDAVGARIVAVAEEAIGRAGTFSVRKAGVTFVASVPRA